MDARRRAADTDAMSEVHAADHAARMEEKRQQEKTQEEQRSSKAAFEKRLNQDKSAKTAAQERQTSQSKVEKSGQEHQLSQNQQQAAQHTAKGQKTAAKKGQQETKKANEGGVLAHVRGQGGQNVHLQDRTRAQLAAMGGKDAEAAAAQSQEGNRALGKKGDESVATSKANEKRATKDVEKERIRETEKEEVRNESAQEAKAAQAAQDLRGMQQVQAQSQAVDADGKRQGGGGQGQPGQQGQQQRVAEQQDVKGPSQSSVRRAAKAEEIQKLCEKLLDNFYLGAAPDGSAMMRMELKEGVLAGLIIDLKVDDQRKVRLELSGGNKEAIDFVTSSRGELSRALGKKGLVLESVNAR